MPKVKEKEIISGIKKIAMKKAVFKIAKEMKMNNEPIDKIIKYTGLTKIEMEKL